MHLCKAESILIAPFKELKQKLNPLASQRSSHINRTI